jgi:transposase
MPGAAALCRVCERLICWRDRGGTFGATRRELLALADWLRCWGVTKVGSEATGDYWKVPYFLLEAEGFDCDLYNAAHVKALPGRPTWSQPQPGF